MDEIKYTENRFIPTEDEIMRSIIKGNDVCNIIESEKDLSMKVLILSWVQEYLSDTYGVHFEKSVLIKHELHKADE